MSLHRMPFFLPRSQPSTPVTQVDLVESTGSALWLGRVRGHMWDVLPLTGAERPWSSRRLEHFHCYTAFHSRHADEILPSQVAPSPSLSICENSFTRYMYTVWRRHAFAANISWRAAFTESTDTWVPSPINPSILGPVVHEPRTRRELRAGADSWDRRKTFSNPTRSRVSVACNADALR